jgi:hypothetical protein
MMNEDFTPLGMAAITVHELFISLVNAGFTRDEALKIVISQLPPKQAEEK